MTAPTDTNWGKESKSRLTHKNQPNLYQAYYSFALLQGTALLLGLCLKESKCGIIARNLKKRNLD